MLVVNASTAPETEGTDIRDVSWSLRMIPLTGDVISCEQHEGRAGIPSGPKKRR
jgi:hypothetical protein